MLPGEKPRTLTREQRFDKRKPEALRVTLTLVLSLPRRAREKRTAYLNALEDPMEGRAPARLHVWRRRSFALHFQMRAQHTLGDISFLLAPQGGERIEVRG
jgi:hypothetical protein